MKPNMFYKTTIKGRKLTAVKVKHVERSTSPYSGEFSRQVVRTKLRGSEGMRASTPTRREREASQRF